MRCRECGESFPRHWHLCPSRAEDSECPCPGCNPQPVWGLGVPHESPARTAVIDAACEYTDASVACSEGGVSRPGSDALTRLTRAETALMLAVHRMRGAK